MANRNDQKKKGSGGKVAGAAAILLLLAGGGWFGFGGGSGLLNGTGDGGNSILPNTTAQQPATVSAAPVEEAPVQNTANDSLAITVNESSILLNGEDCSVEALEQALLTDYADGVSVTLTDDHAIKETYDTVAALLDRLDIPYQAE